MRRNNVLFLIITNYIVSIKQLRSSFSIQKLNLSKKFGDIARRMFAKSNLGELTLAFANIRASIPVFRDTPLLCGKEARRS